MPYQSEWVDPEVAVEHNDKSVYHVYCDNDFEQGPRTYWFTTDPVLGDDDGPPFVFDIREIFPAAKYLPADDRRDDAILNLVRAAIDAGKLTFPDKDDGPATSQPDIDGQFPSFSTS
jgi:hypothetical protein